MAYAKTWTRNYKQNYWGTDMKRFDIYELLPYKDKEMIDDIVFDALREAGYEPADLAWELVVEFFDENESE